MERLGKNLVRWRFWVVAVWTVLLAVSIYFGLQLPGELRGNGFAVQDGRFAQVEDTLNDRFDRAGASMIVLLEGGDLETVMAEQKTRLESVSGVDGVITPAENPDARSGDAAYFVLEFEDQEAAEAAIADVRAELIRDTDTEVRLTGEPVFAQDLNEASKNDLIRAELIGIPVALVVLLLVFGTPLAAFMPLFVGLITFIVAAGSLFFFTQTMELSIFVLNAVAMIAIALGIDFSLLLVNRYREELAKGLSREAAIVRTVATAGRSILFSGLCVFVGLAGLLFIQVDVFQAIALGALIAVAGAVLSALTLLPSALYIVGDAINKGRLIRTNETRSEVRWQKLARFVMKRPVVMTLVALLLLLPSLWFVRDLELNIPDADALPTSYESRAALERWDDVFGETSTDAVLLFETNDLTDSMILDELTTLTDELNEDPIVDNVTTFLTASNLTAAEFQQLVQVAPEQLEAFERLVTLEGNTDLALVNVSFDVPPSDKAAQAFVRDWRDQGFDVGGPAAFNEEIYEEIYDSIPYAVVTVILATMVILMWAFRSILIPIKAIIMNVLGLGATFGLLVIIFESGYVYDAETISILTPVFIFSLVFGLSMDYEVFLVSRIEEYYRETGDNDYATEMGLAKTSKIITSAAIIMIVVTGAFAFTGVSPIKQLGVGIALAIFIDATIIRMLLVPSLMKLFGDWNWWWFGKKDLPKRNLH
ncbi:MULTISPECIES: MMPL family transporter [Exiguobacterium]|uniref:MMPL family transporter n=1 Tax=Exiguobacterium TaxID=33986 RepID=UPI00087768B7|nr:MULTISPECIES: MMPL family transporter [Exiguobacterium]TCI34613.1 MMPL family transporter [Exiguobacterium sp. SH4S7]TCI44366.1 MMPL family transporter [Exiguobacterium sp. SH5S32]TCI50630.1 MMPL family transporter [Exiguobacterium sp. SH1S4]TCI60687.1 MMPL family transporter [Exiguobacterium sp. SH0S2]TCI69590.1 MMPL family transporter [Exiguobacterium sp. SH1S1]